MSMRVLAGCLWAGRRLVRLQDRVRPERLLGRQPPFLLKEFPEDFAASRRVPLVLALERGFDRKSGADLPHFDLQLVVLAGPPAFPPARLHGPVYDRGSKR